MRSTTCRLQHVMRDQPSRAGKSMEGKLSKVVLHATEAGPLKALMQESFSRSRTRAKPTVPIYHWATDRIDLFRIWVVLVLGTDGVHHTLQQSSASCSTTESDRALCGLSSCAHRQIFMGHERSGNASSMLASSTATVRPGRARTP